MKIINNCIIVFFKASIRLHKYHSYCFHYIVTRLLFILNGVKYSSFTTKGVPFLSVAYGSSLVIGKNFTMNNTFSSNPIGGFPKCKIFVDRKARICIGDNVGISGVTLTAQDTIIIGNNVNLGGGVCIYDTDFHSLDTNNRNDKSLDSFKTSRKKINIGNNVFIGAHSTILKGVTIGENSIVGACSLVVKDIPKNEIWGGNPAKFIRNISIT